MRAEDVLPGDQNEITIQGATVRKGTVGAFLANAAVFTDPASTAIAREAALQDIAASLPALRALGLFELMEIRDPDLRARVEARPGTAVAITSDHAGDCPTLRP